jgi:hypothetical protein
VSEATAPAGGLATLVRISEGAVLVALSWFLLAFLWIVVRRVGYPYALEWMEGGTLGHIARVLAGKPIYGPPSLEFTPYMYTPLYAWIAAPLVGLLGVGLPSARVVSILATLGLFAVVYRLVLRTTSDPIAASIGVGSLWAAFVVGGGWLDLVRIDAVFLLLLSAGLLVLITSERHDLAAGVLFALAFLTKQTAVMIAAPMCIARLFTQRGLRRLHFGLAFGLVAGVSTLLLDRATSGWYLYYVFEMPQGHKFVDRMFVDFWSLDLRPIPVYALAALFVLTRRRDWRSAVTRVAAAVGLVGASWLSRINVGGAANSLWPALIFFAWMIGEAIAYLRAPGPRANARLLVAYGLCLVQFAILFYDPRQQIPSPEDRRAGDELVALLRSFEGPVLVPHHSELPPLAGKPGHAHEMAIWDVLNVGGKRGRDILAAEVHEALGSGRYAAVVTDGPWLRAELRQRYVRKPLRRADGRSFPQTMLGWRTRPTFVWKRIDESAAGAR